MLVLTRKQGEKIRIGKDVTITVIRMKGKAIRLGIEAPHHLSVLRGELCDRESFGELADDATPVESSAAKKAASRPEQAVASDAWPVAQTDPQRPAGVTASLADAAPMQPRVEARPLRTMIQQRARVGEAR